MDCWQQKRGFICGFKAALFLTLSLCSLLVKETENDLLHSEHASIPLANHPSLINVYMQRVLRGNNRERGESESSRARRKMRLPAVGLVSFICVTSNLCNEQRLIGGESRAGRALTFELNAVDGIHLNRTGRLLAGVMLAHGLEHVLEFLGIEHAESFQSVVDERADAFRRAVMLPACGKRRDSLCGMRQFSRV